jgi:hypothetical protein
MAQQGALKGNLGDFSLPDVFQLIHLSRKTGVLRITHESAEGSIWFREGGVFSRRPIGAVSCSASGSPPKDASPPTR